jgi:tetratricopeptide (TPR) repeat protein
VSLVDPQVASDPRDYALRYALAQAYRGQGDFAAAVEEFTACAALAPESHLAFFYRGLSRLEQENLRGARHDFDEVLRLAPGLPAGLLNRAIARERLGDIPGAIADLSASLANGITETRVYFLRARLFDKLGDTEGAQRDRQEGFRRPPRDEASFLARGVAHLPSDAKAALAEFQAALVRYPESIAARRNIAHVLSEHLGRPAEAIAELDAVAKRCPRDAAAIVGRGVLLARLGRRDEAHRDGETALQASRDGQTVYQAACIYALTTSTAVEDAPKALKLLAEALLVDPRSARVAATDADLRAIAKEPEFRRLLVAAATLDRARSAEVKPQ